MSISRNVVILGKVGSGKRTLGNHIVGKDIFQIESALGTENVGAHYEEVKGENADILYRILTVDTESLETRYNNPVPYIEEKFQEIHSVIFTVPHGLYTRESHGSLVHAVKNFNQKVKRVSALIITHCEGMTDEQRQAIIAEFTGNAHSSQVVAFMQHGTHAVGFPDLSTLPPNVKLILQNGIGRDEKAIRELVEQCKIPLSVNDLRGLQPYTAAAALIIRFLIIIAVAAAILMGPAIAFIPATLWGCNWIREKCTLYTCTLCGWIVDGIGEIFAER